MKEKKHVYRVNCLKLQEYKIQQLGVILHIYQKSDNFGRRGRGYDVKHLIDGLSEVLGLGLDEPIILIGVGNLGSAILKYNRWQYTVGKIVCGYDMDKNKEGERFGVKICHIDKLEETFPSDCKIAILAISENVQETVDRLMKLGIKGIVDFRSSGYAANRIDHHWSVLQNETWTGNQIRIDGRNRISRSLLSC